MCERQREGRIKAQRVWRRRFTIRRVARTRDGYRGKGRMREDGKGGREEGREGMIDLQFAPLSHLARSFSTQKA